MSVWHLILLICREIPGFKILFFFFLHFELCMNVNVLYNNNHYNKKESSFKSFSFFMFFLFLFFSTGSLYLPDIWRVQHGGESAVCLKADWVSERNDKFLMAPHQWDRFFFFLTPPPTPLHMGVPLPFMLGLTYMHPGLPLTTDTQSKERVIPQAHWPIFHCLFKFLNSQPSI